MTCQNVLTSSLVTWLVMGTSLLGGTKSFTLLVCRSSLVILSSLSADAIDVVSSSLSSLVPVAGFGDFSIAMFLFFGVGFNCDVPVGVRFNGNVPVDGSGVGFDGSGF